MPQVQVADLMPRWLGFAAAAALVLTLAACGGDLSQETFDQINLGMSLTEVEDILGAEGEKQDTSQASISSAGIMSSTQSNFQQYAWRSTDLKREILVDFREGKVISKSKRGF